MKGGIVGIGGGAMDVGSASTASEGSSGSATAGGPTTTGASSSGSSGLGGGVGATGSGGAPTSSGSGAGGNPEPCLESGVEGTVTGDAGASLAGVRVTLVAPGFFHEVRTSASGAFSAATPAGTYTVGASLRGREYVEQTVVVADACAPTAIALGIERIPGSGRPSAMQGNAWAGPTPA